MPVQLRIFYLKKLVNVKEKEQKEIEKSYGKITDDSSKNKGYQGPSTK